MAASRNGRLALSLLLVAGGMVGMSYAAVPLYDLFCRVTGYGGTTNVAEAVSDEVLERRIKVRFVANTHRDLAWEFAPAQTALTIKVGEQGLAFYRASNYSDRRITGTATFNVSPHKAGYYFTKVECFCFVEQTLEPGESVDMPVMFFVDPEIDEDRNLDEVTEIALSYTFFETERYEPTKVALNDAVPQESSELKE
ncbi:MAG: cytochrome c oxidase assembly protein [Sphingomonadales bacterium]|nr:cytochrome c oxidase assembly protein [Sphingomonadales bacterium]